MFAASGNEQRLKVRDYRIPTAIYRNPLFLQIIRVPNMRAWEYRAPFIPGFSRPIDYSAEAIQAQLAMMSPNGEDEGEGEHADYMRVVDVLHNTH